MKTELFAMVDRNYRRKRAARQPKRRIRKGRLACLAAIAVALIIWVGVYAH